MGKIFKVISWGMTKGICNTLTLNIALPDIFYFDSEKPKKAVGPDAEDFSCPFLRSQTVIVPLQQPYKGYSLYECIQKPLESCQRCREKSKTMNLTSF